jgi:tRNA A-37 threonylcarbamoyl transferase component Bud32
MAATSFVKLLVFVLLVLSCIFGGEVPSNVKRVPRLLSGPEYNQVMRGLSGPPNSGAPISDGATDTSQSSSQPDTSASGSNSNSVATSSGSNSKTQTGTSASSAATSSPAATSAANPGDINGNPLPSHSSSSPTGLIVGLVIGLLALCAIIVIATLLVWRRLKKNKKYEKAEPKVAIAMTPVMSPSNYEPVPVASAYANTTLVNTGTITRKAAGGEGWEITYSELKLQQKLGEGEFGVVYHAEWRGGDVAVKQLKSSHLSHKQVEEFMDEFKLMKNLRPHPNIVQVLGIVSEPMLCIVTEYMDGGSLLTYISGPEKISPEIVLGLLQGIAQGLLHLHYEGIVHRDLAARNILLKKMNGGTFQPKISDFGLSRITEDVSSNTRTQSDTGPLKIMAPECILDKSYSNKSDVWAFGVLCAEIITRTDPMPDMLPVQVAGKVARGEFHCPIPDAAAPVVRSVMEKCFYFRADQRPDMQEIVNELNPKK